MLTHSARWIVLLSLVLLLNACFTNKVNHAFPPLHEPQTKMDILLIGRAEGGPAKTVARGVLMPFAMATDIILFPLEAVVFYTAMGLSHHYYQSHRQIPLDSSSYRVMTPERTTGPYSLQFNSTSQPSQ